MKNKKLIIIVIIVLMFVSIIVSGGCFSGCSIENTQLESNKQTHSSNDITKDYSIMEKSGEYYIVFDDICLYENQNDFVGNEEAPHLDFPSVKDFKETVTQGKLNTEQKKILSKFEKTDDDKIKICDFDNIQEPILPEKIQITNISWSGEGYTYCLSGDAFSMGYIYHNPEDVYNRRYEDYVNEYDNELITIKEQYIDSNQKTITCYQTSTSYIKSVRFSLEIGKKTIFVEKEYILETAYADLLPVSSTIPLRVTMFCIDGDINYEIKLYHLTEEPSDLYLMGFSSKKYVDNVNIEKS